MASCQPGNVLIASLLPQVERWSGHASKTTASDNPTGNAFQSSQVFSIPYTYYCSRFHNYYLFITHIQLLPRKTKSTPAYGSQVVMQVHMYVFVTILFVTTYIDRVCP